MKTNYLVVLLFALSFVLGCFTPNDKFNTTSVESSLMPIPTAKKEREKFFIQFYYYDLENVLEESQSDLNVRLTDDAAVLDNYMNKLGLIYGAEMFNEPIKIDNWSSLNELDKIMWSKHSSGNVIPVFLDSKWHTPIPNSFRKDPGSDHPGYIFMRINELGNVPVLFHEIVHFIATEKHDRIPDGSDSKCSLLPLHISEDFMEICEQYGQQNLVPNCFNVMTPSFTVPLMLFMTDQQVKWLNDPTCIGESTMDQVCNFNRPLGWRESINDDGIVLENCCVVAKFDVEDVSNFIVNTPLDEQAIYSISQEISSFLTCASDYTLKAENADIQYKKSEPSAGSPNLEYDDLSAEIERNENKIKGIYFANGAAPMPDVVWNQYFNVSKGFIIYWLKEFKEYELLLNIEYSLLTENMSNADSLQEVLLDRRLAIRDEANAIIQKNYVQTKGIKNISTGKAAIWNAALANGGERQAKRPATVITNPDKSWAVLPNAQWITYSPSLGRSKPCNAKKCGDCDPYEVEYCFDLKSKDNVKFDFNIGLDDFGKGELIGSNGLVIPLWSFCEAKQGQSFFRKTQAIREEFLLPEGNYCIKAEIYNYIGPTGFILSGYVKSDFIEL